MDDPVQIPKAIEDAMEVEYAIDFDHAKLQSHLNEVAEHHVQPTAWQYIPKPEDSLQELQSAIDQD